MALFKNFETKNIFEVLEKSGINWEVFPQSVITTGGIYCPECKAVVREDNKSILSIEKSSYHLITNFDLHIWRMYRWREESFSSG